MKQYKFPLESVMNTVILGCCEKGIPIAYNNEHNVETVFLFSTDMQLLQKQTFQFILSPSEIEWNAWKQTCQEKPIVNIKEGYLYYSFRYQVSFAHYLTQTLPLLFDFIHHAPPTTKLLVPRHTHTDLQKEIFSLLHIPDERIFILESEQLYKIINLYPRKFYESQPAPFTQDHIWIFKELQKGLTFTKQPNTRLVYIRRDGRANPSTNNSETGILRQIKNESELLAMLETEFGFEIITMGDKSLQEKADSLAGIRIAITPLGANCMNFVFGQAPEKILLLSNERPIGEDYYIPLASKVNSTDIKFDTFFYPIVEHSDPTNRWNGSYYVDLHKIRDWIKRSLS